MEPTVPAAAAAAPESEYGNNNLPMNRLTSHGTSTTTNDDDNRPAVATTTSSPIQQLTDDDRIAACYDQSRQIRGDAIVVPTAKRTRGKVRDCWEPIQADSTEPSANDDTTTTTTTTTSNGGSCGAHVLAMVTTDRQSGFDRQLAVVPFKGAVLNLCSQFWFDRTADIVPNHLVAVPHPSVSIVRRCRPFSIEFVVRYVACVVFVECGNQQVGYVLTHPQIALVGFILLVCGMGTITLPLVPI
jgi:SAICAR synthetase